MRTVGLSLIVAALLALPSYGQESEPERIDLRPDEKAGWSPRNVGAGLSTVFTGPAYWYSDKETLIQTVPAEAHLALYYIRSNFQKRFERGVAPVIVVTPPRIYATDKDVVAVRVASDGFLSKEVKFRVFEAPEEVLVQLDPLPNNLVFLGQTHLAGRTTMVLRTTEEPDMRVTKPRSGEGFMVALTQTANKLESTPSGSSGLVKNLAVQQLGEDLVLQVKTREPDLEVRSRSSYDPIRKEHLYVFDVMRKGARPPSSMQVRREIEEVRYSVGSRCNELFASVLRDRLEPQMIARAFRPSGGIAESYQREAMLRLGRFDGGSVETLSGESYRTGSPIELALAIQSASTVRDYLGLLGAMARTHPEPAEFLRALLAPDLTAADFAPIYKEAVAARAGCS